MSAAADQRLQGAVDAIAMFQAVCAAVELGIPERLAAPGCDSAQLADENGWHRLSLLRLLRALCSAGFACSQDDRHFALTDDGRSLCARADDSLAQWVLLWGRDLWRQWPELGRCVRTGVTARRHLEAAQGLDHLDRDAERANRFHLAMREIGRPLAGAVLRAADFGRFGCIADIGGGHGDLLATILAAHPRARGILFDRPHALDGARARLQAAGVQDRCELIAGDFFEAVPTGADAYLLQHVLHDWDDAAAARLLGCCAAACGSASLWVIEHRVPELPSMPDCRAARKDLNMMIGPGGRERSAGQYAQLLRRSGFEPLKAVPAADHLVIEAVRCA